MAPSTVTFEAWTHFRVQILSCEGEQTTVAWESNNYPKPKSRSSVTRTIKSADLQRLEEGTYGRSVRSGAPIPDERLEADPAAELTVEEAQQG